MYFNSSSRDSKSRDFSHSRSSWDVNSRKKQQQQQAPQQQQRQQLGPKESQWLQKHQEQQCQ
jgi:hypothetical protein